MNLDKLFKHLADQHGLLLLESEKREIADCLPSWCSVDEAMPDEHEKVLVQFGDQNILVGILDSNQQWTVFWSDGRNVSDPDRPIRYWMPLPAAYNMEGGED
jgi:hypothetical protein